MAESCCNPFNLPRHDWSTRNKDLRIVKPWMCEKAAVTVGSKICDTCRKKLANLPDLESVCMSGVDSKREEHYLDVPEASAAINRCLSEIGETPLSKSVSHNNPKRIEDKIEKLTDAMKGLFIDSTATSSTQQNDGGEIILQLKQKFQTTTKRSEQLQILTVLPQSWTRKRIQSEFGVSDYMARKCKQLVRDKGVLSNPDPVPGPSLPSETVQLVINFYQSDEISRHMPGMKDFVSVKQEGKRVHTQKRLILSNLKEVYHAFKDAYPDKKIGFSRFAELRPQHCVLAGASGTHTVCVCTTHQNMKLMFLGPRLSEIDTPEGINYPTYHHCLASILCNPPLPICYFGECTSCPGISKLRDDLTTLLDENVIDNITYKQWVSVDRSTLETYTKPVDEFVEKFCEKLELLRPHSFIAAQQASYYSNSKSGLAPREMLVTVDFSENYSFVLQDAAQGFHWNNSQATIHPFAAYFKNKGELCHLSYVVVSECLHHDTTAVHLYQKCFTAFLRKFFPTRSQPHKIIYFSDGAASQYKNRKNFINLCHHKEDFGITAEWHFSATAHGKGACDGLGGTVKRLAARASLQRPYNDQIMTARQLFDWATISIPTVHFDYCSSEDYELEQKYLEQRFMKARTIPGTRKLHSFIPVSEDKLQVKAFSASSSCREERVTTTEVDLPPESIAGFVTCMVRSQWCLACVLHLSQDESEVKLTLLHPTGPSSSYRYPKPEHIVTVATRDILTVVDPRTRTGRVYTLSPKEVKSASQKLGTFLRKQQT